MKISLLNQRIQLQKATTVIDNIGNHTQEWLPVFSVYATISGQSPNETTGAGSRRDDSRITFTIRWSKQAAAIVSTEYRVVFCGQVYEILGVDHVNYKKQALKLYCRKENQWSK